MYYRAILSTAAILKFFDVRGMFAVFTAKKKDGLTQCIHYLTCALK